MLATKVKHTVASYAGGTITLGANVTGYDTIGAQPNSDGRYVRYFVGKTNGDYLECVGIYTHSGTTLTVATVLQESVGGVVTNLPTTPFDPAANDEVFIAPSGLNGNAHVQNGVAEAGLWLCADNQTFDTSGCPIGGNSAGRIVLSTAFFATPFRITEIGAYLTTASAGGNFRVGLYEMLPDGNAGKLIYGSGDLSTTATGLVTETLSSPLLLPAGIYLEAHAADNATVRAQGSAGSDQGFARQGKSATTATVEAHQYYNQAYGAMPADLTGVTPDGNLRNNITQLAYV